MKEKMEEEEEVKEEEVDIDEVLKAS